MSFSSLKKRAFTILFWFCQLALSEDDVIPVQSLRGLMPLQLSLRGKTNRMNTGYKIDRLAYTKHFSSEETCGDSISIHLSY
jgi:hypothetical protein